MKMLEWFGQITETVRSQRGSSFRARLRGF